MNTSDRSVLFFVLGSSFGGLLGFVLFLWPSGTQSTLTEINLFWVTCGLMFFSALAAVGGGMIGLATERISRDLKAGGDIRPYLKVAVQYIAIALFVLLVRGNRDPLDLVFMSALSAITGLVLCSLAGPKTKTAASG